MFPNLTVLDVSRNKLRTEYELEFLVYLETMAELRVSGNDMFIEGYKKRFSLLILRQEDALHKQYPYLEIINDKQYHKVTSREKEQLGEIKEYIKEVGLMDLETCDKIIEDY